MVCPDKSSAAGNAQVGYPESASGVSEIVPDRPLPWAVPAPAKPGPDRPAQTAFSRTLKAIHRRPDRRPAPAAGARRNRPSHSTGTVPRWRIRNSNARLNPGSSRATGNTLLQRGAVNDPGNGPWSDCPDCQFASRDGGSSVPGCSWTDSQQEIPTTSVPDRRSGLWSNHKATVPPGPCRPGQCG